MKTLERSLSGLVLVLGLLLSACSDPTAPGGAEAPGSGTYALASYDGKAVPALYETADYGSTMVVSGTLVIAFTLMDITVNYTEQDPTGVQTDAYAGRVSVVWKASAGGVLAFGDGSGGIYTLTGRFHGDSILISVPDTLSSGAAHTGLYAFIKQK